MSETADAADSETTAATKRVMYAELAAVAAGDLDELVSLFAEEAVVLSQAGAFHGHDEIRRMFAEFFAAATPEDTFEVVHEFYSGRFGYIVWATTTPTTIIPLGTDTFVVEDGRISLLSFAAHVVPKS
ncbi:MAG: nuclear transport factor 2 family protein [Actinobacteria bacterium]|nr:nuclear transport factor 2 family protein [Actinomycetota bacterium]